MLAKQLNEVTICGYCVYRLFTLPPSDQHCMKASLTAIMFTPKLARESTHKKMAIDCFAIASWWVCLSVVFLISSWTSWMREKQGAVESGMEASEYETVITLMQVSLAKCIVNWTMFEHRETLSDHVPMSFISMCVIALCWKRAKNYVSSPLITAGDDDTQWLLNVSWFLPGVKGVCVFLKKKQKKTLHNHALNVTIFSCLNSNLNHKGQRSDNATHDFCNLNLNYFDILIWEGVWNVQPDTVAKTPVNQSELVLKLNPV